jgi:hypothetical protein
MSLPSAMTPNQTKSHFVVGGTGFLHLKVRQIVRIQ